MSVENAGTDVDNNSTDAEFVVNDEDERNPSNYSSDFEPSTSGGKFRRRSKNWQYYELVDNVKKIARCKFCAREISFLSNGNLKKHLLRQHSGVVYSEEESQRLLKNGTKRKHSGTAKPKYRYRMRSPLWKLFDIVDEANKLATCKICSNEFSYTCISNLGKHLRRMHQGALGASTDEEGECDVAEEQSSPVWAYFKCLSQELKLASCLICKKRVEYYDFNDLTKHLSRKHPKAHAELESVSIKPKKLMITNNGDIYEINEGVTKLEPKSDVAQTKDNGSNEETDALDTTDYLDETLFNKPLSVTKRKQRHISNQRLQLLQDDSKRIRINNTSSLQEDENSLDIFGKYIVSLLKKLPKHKSDQLQADFVRQIMNIQTSDGKCNGLNTHTSDKNSVSSTP